MATFGCITFLLFMQVCGACLSQERSVVFGGEKTVVAFHFRIPPEGYDTILFYRPLGEESKLLMTVTGEENTLHSKRVSYSASNVTGTFRFTINSLFDSGTYIVEIRRDKHPITKHTYCMRICSQYEEIDGRINSYSSYRINSHKDFKFDVPFFDPDHRETLKIYKKVEPQELLEDSQTIGTDVCSQISPGEERSGMQVLHQGSSVWFFNVSAEQDIGQYYIITRKGTDCCQTLISILIYAFNYGTSNSLPGINKNVYLWQLSRDITFVWAKRRVTLFCTQSNSRDRREGLIMQAVNGNVEWETPAKRLSLDHSVNVIYSGRSPRKEEMYIETKNYSLVIQSVKQSDSGDYNCKKGQMYSSKYELVVCPVPDTTYVMFSLNDTVTLTCDSNFTARPITQWYRQRGDEEEHLFLKNWFDWDESALVHLPVDIRDRVDTCHPHNTLVISNLSPNDSGVYQCMRGGRGLACYSHRFHLVYRHPYGINSPFYRVYASMLGGGLMVTICAVAYANLKNRKGLLCQKTPEGENDSSGQPEREGENSVDEASI